MSFSIKEFIHSNDLKCLIIAEIGVNHGGNLDQAISMIDDVVSNGGHAVKFQSYKADLIARKDSPAYWDTNQESTKSQYELFSKYDSFGESDFLKLSKYCQQKNILFLSTPFDEHSANYLKPLMPFYKIASVDITNHCLLKHVSSFGKPVVLSTGASTISEIESAVTCCRLAGASEVCLLHCVVNYPTNDSDANLLRIHSLKSLFPELIIGYSDHTLPSNNMLTCTSSFIYGARIIEKHFTYNKSLPGNDHYHSMNGYDLKVLVENINQENLLRGNGEINYRQNEGKSRLFARRSLTAIRDLDVGHIISSEDFIPKRPGDGISPSDLEKILNKSLNIPLHKDQPITWKHI
jgi:N-acetylneuraminate synthase